MIIKWASCISRDFRDLNNTGDLREGFPHILLKITGYILAGELTPRMFMERVENVYLANLTFGNGVPDPIDVLEEEYINECDERETVMDLMNPWGEDDAKETETEFFPWEDLSRSETTPDSAVAPLPREEGRGVTDGDEEAWHEDEMKLHTVPVAGDDDEDFSEQVPDVDTMAKPDERWATRREGRLPGPSHIYSRRMPLPRSNNQPQVAQAPDACVSTEKEDSYDFAEEEPEEESGPVDLVAVWKQASNSDVNALDLWLIVREKELPGRNPDEYLADVIRWTMQFWPRRDQLKAGSRSFAQPFKEIHQDYARHIGKTLSPRRSPEEEQVNETPAPIDLVRVWKEVSDKHVSRLDFRDILHDEELPEENPDEYLAKVIRWTMQSWPKRGELRFGSQTFALRFKEIHKDYVVSMSGAESSSRLVDSPQEEEF